MINTDWAVITKMKNWLARPGSELDKLRKGAVRFWQRFVEMLQFPAKQLDPMTAELEFVHLLAWERDIAQIPGESELIYRTRVKYALPFAKGAGSKAGWLEMFNKLGIPQLTIDERFSEIDWDVVDLQFLDADLGSRQALIDYICRQYGRTTRRYQLSTIAIMPVTSRLSAFSNHQNYTVAAVNNNLLPAKRLMTMDSGSSFHVAKTQQGT